MVRQNANYKISNNMKVETYNRKSRICNNPVWRYRLPCNRAGYGSATSLVISGDRVIYLNDLGKPYLMALNLNVRLYIKALPLIF